MSKQDGPVRQTVRFPKHIHAAIEAARGEPSKPRASFNDTLVYLVQAGLRATGQAVKQDAREDVPFV